MNKNLHIFILVLVSFCFLQVKAFAVSPTHFYFVGTEDSTDKKTDNIDKKILQDSLENLLKKVKIEFTNKKVEHSSDSVYFNICKITNTENKPISGDLKFRVPSGWQLIADPSMTVNLKPNQTISLPIRLSIPPQAVGGVAYIVDGSIVTNEGIYSGSAFIKIPLKSKWDFDIDNSTIYFNEFFDVVPFKMYLSNNGNATELFKFNFTVGKLFNILEIDKDEFYIELPPYTDTIIEYHVSPKSTLTSEERQSYREIWKESTVDIKVSSSDHVFKRKNIWFRDLDNDYVNQRQEKFTPLNVNLSIFNMLSQNPSAMNLSVFGQILFNNNHNIDYVVNARNIARQGVPFGTSLFNNPNNLTYRLTYNWNKRIRAEVGIINSYTLHTSRGLGARVAYKISDNDEVRASFVNNLFLPIWIASGEYIRNIKGIKLNIGGSYEDNDFVHYNAYSLQLGSFFSIARKHFFNVQLLGTNAIFDTNFGVGTPSLDPRLGVTYFMSYNGNFSKKLRLNVSTRNDQFNFIRLRPSNVISGNLRYTINEKNRINAFGNFNSISPSPYSANPLFSGMYNETQIYRATWVHQFNKTIALETGPMYRVLNRRIFDTINGNLQDFDNRFIGLYSNVRIRIDERTIVTPNLSIGRTSFVNELNNTSTLAPMLSTTLGVSINGRNYSMNANYVRGPNFFVNEDFLFFDEVSLETVSIRGQINKILRENTIRISAYGTYYLRLPSNNQNVMLSTRADFYFKKGWNTFLTANIFTNTNTIPGSEGLSTQRFFSLNMGVNKAFFIQQPKVKYFDVKLICFNDLNGDGIRDDNEPLLPNIRVLISRDMDKMDNRNLRWGEQELITSVNGEINIENMPDIGYTFSFNPMINLGNLYNVNGDVQNIEINEDQTLYIPFAENYRVSGKIELIRDEFSSKGLIDISGVRVTATNAFGQIFSALTDKDGNYLINVPQSGGYVIAVNNIFGADFYIDKETYVIQFDGFKTYQVDFKFYEGKRKVNFGGKNFFNFNSLNDLDDNEDSGDNTTTPANNNVDVDVNVEDKYMQNAKLLKQQIDAISAENEKSIQTPVDPEKVTYMIEIGIFEKEINTDVANLILTLNFTPTPIKIGDITIYATQSVKTHKEVKDQLQSISDAGFTEAIIVGIYEGKVISEKKAREYRNE